jgi:hypothetical protein
VTYVLLLRSTSCCVTQYINVTNQSWGMILLNYTGQAVEGVYDSSYRASVAGVPVLFGTTPEYGQWTVLKDITVYESLLRGNVSVQFVLGAAVTSGYFLTSFSISFYPLAPGASPPREPDRIVPLWPYTSETDTAPNTTVMGTVPTDVVNATLELYAYGFTGGASDEEFWYTLTPPFREIQVQVNNTTFASVLPFPYINTGGIDLFAWDPITGAFTLNDRPYQVSVTAALGLLEGTHQFRVQVLGRLPQARWQVGGSLLLYTNASAGPASLHSYQRSTPVFLNTSIPGGSWESVSLSYSYASDVPTASGTTRVSAWTNESFNGESAQFQKTIGTTSFVNSTTNQVESTQFAERSTSASGSGWLNSTALYRFSLNSSDEAVGTGAVGTDVNETVVLHSLGQEWNESRLDTERNASGAVTSGYSFDDKVAVNGNYKDEQKIVSAGAAQIVQIYFNYQNTTKTFLSSVTAFPLVAYYNHTLSGQLASATAPQQTVTVDVPVVHDAVGLTAARGTTDAGQANRIVATVLGAGGPFQFQWSGLPAGCSGSSGPFVTCNASIPGTARVVVTSVGATGNSAVSATLLWTILPDPAATVVATPVSLDLGRTVNVTGSISGGLGPYRCVWEAGGVQLVPATPCTLNLSYSPVGVGPVSITLNVTDALGMASHAAPVNLSIASDPGVALVLTPDSSTVDVGTTVTVQAFVSGGVPPYNYSWFSNGVATTAGVTGATYTVTPNASGTLSITVGVTDHTGFPIISLPAVLTVTGGATPGGQGGNGSAASSGIGPMEAGLILGVVAVAGVLVIVLVLVLRRPRGS